MGATEEQIQFLSDGHVTHVSYILILYSIAFILFLCMSPSHLPIFLLAHPNSIVLFSCQYPSSHLRRSCVARVRDSQAALSLYEHHKRRRRS